MEQGVEELKRLLHRSVDVTGGITTTSDLLVINTTASWDVYVTSTLSFWTAVMKGPTDSPYDKGAFDAYIVIPRTNSPSPPQVCFVTRLR